ncbi:hypothetical protein BESB_072710 [Besnoitia besnoiti]|uniref:Uncharacterized protein n=1 Tax=Besnoitia besnoiti TaxID=94643 RepID=A0A2A9M869_BESBE|nr:uncharacterized protein BESB_072710 [Besnoitia besnoiti]PFH34119.1 hypothetical protein BESB_072710 [Besnoitia besnoiti]
MTAEVRPPLALVEVQQKREAAGPQTTWVSSSPLPAFSSLTGTPVTPLPPSRLFASCARRAAATLCPTASLPPSDSALSSFASLSGPVVPSASLRSSSACPFSSSVEGAQSLTALSSPPGHGTHRKKPSRHSLLPAGENSGGFCDDNEHGDDVRSEGDSGRSDGTGEGGCSDEKFARPHPQSRGRGEGSLHTCFPELYESAHALSLAPRTATGGCHGSSSADTGDVGRICGDGLTRPADAQLHGTRKDTQAEDARGSNEEAKDNGHECRECEPLRDDGDTSRGGVAATQRQAEARKKSRGKREWARGRPEELKPQGQCREDDGGTDTDRPQEERKCDHDESQRYAEGGRTFGKEHMQADDIQEPTETGRNMGAQELPEWRTPCECSSSGEEEPWGEMNETTQDTRDEREGRLVPRSSDPTESVTQEYQNRGSRGEGMREAPDVAEGKEMSRVWKQGTGAGAGDTEADAPVFWCNRARHAMTIPGGRGVQFSLARDSAKADGVIVAALGSELASADAAACPGEDSENTGGERTVTGRSRRDQKDSGDGRGSGSLLRVAGHPGSEDAKPTDQTNATLLSTTGIHLQFPWALFRKRKPGEASAGCPAVPSMHARPPSIARLQLETQPCCSHLTASRPSPPASSSRASPVDLRFPARLAPRGVPFRIHHFAPPSLSCAASPVCHRSPRPCSMFGLPVVASASVSACAPSSPAVLRAQSPPSSLLAFPASECPSVFSSRAEPPAVPPRCPRSLSPVASPRRPCLPGSSCSPKHSASPAPCVLYSAPFWKLPSALAGFLSSVVVDSGSPFAEALPVLLACYSSPRFPPFAYPRAFASPVPTRPLPRERDQPSLTGLRQSLRWLHRLLQKGPSKLVVRGSRLRPPSSAGASLSPGSRRPAKRAQRSAEASILLLKQGLPRPASSWACTATSSALHADAGRSGEGQPSSVASGRVRRYENGMDFFSFASVLVSSGVTSLSCSSKRRRSCSEREAILALGELSQLSSVASRRPVLSPDFPLHARAACLLHLRTGVQQESEERDWREKTTAEEHAEKQSKRRRQETAQGEERGLTEKCRISAELDDEHSLRQETRRTPSVDAARHESLGTADDDAESSGEAYGAVEKAAACSGRGVCAPSQGDTGRTGSPPGAQRDAVETHPAEGPSEANQHDATEPLYCTGRDATGGSLLEAPEDSESRYPHENEAVAETEGFLPVPPRAVGEEEKAGSEENVERRKSWAGQRLPEMAPDERTAIGSIHALLSLAIRAPAGRTEYLRPAALNMSAASIDGGSGEQLVPKARQEMRGVRGEGENGDEQGEEQSDGTGTEEDIIFSVVGEEELLQEEASLPLRLPLYLYVSYSLPVWRLLPLHSLTRPGEHSSRPVSYSSSSSSSFSSLSRTNCSSAPAVPDGGRAGEWPYPDVREYGIYHAVVELVEACSLRRQQVRLLDFTSDYSAVFNAAREGEPGCLPSRETVLLSSRRRECSKRDHSRASGRVTDEGEAQGGGASGTEWRRNRLKRHTGEAGDQQEPGIASPIFEPAQATNRSDLQMFDSDVTDSESADRREDKKAPASGPDGNKEDDVFTSLAAALDAIQKRVEALGGRVEGVAEAWCFCGFCAQARKVERPGDLPPSLSRLHPSSLAGAPQQPIVRAEGCAPLVTGSTERSALSPASTSTPPRLPSSASFFFGRSPSQPSTTQSSSKSEDTVSAGMWPPAVGPFFRAQGVKGSMLAANVSATVSATGGSAGIPSLWGSGETTHAELLTNQEKYRAMSDRLRHANHGQEHRKRNTANMFIWIAAANVFLMSGLRDKNAKALRHLFCRQSVQIIFPLHLVRRKKSARLDGMETLARTDDGYGRLRGPRNTSLGSENKTEEKVSKPRRVSERDVHSGEQGRLDDAAEPYHVHPRHALYPASYLIAQLETEHGEANVEKTRIKM